VFFSQLFAAAGFQHKVYRTSAVTSKRAIGTVAYLSRKYFQCIIHSHTLFTASEELRQHPTNIVTVVTAAASNLFHSQDALQRLHCPTSFCRLRTQLALHQRVASYQQRFNAAAAAVELFSRPLCLSKIDIERWMIISGTPHAELTELSPFREQLKTWRWDLTVPFDSIRRIILPVPKTTDASKLKNESRINRI
jgi:hypothetical protein